MDNTKYSNAVYAIIDTVAKTIIGGLYLHKHEAAAVRFFADVASTPDSIVAKHPQDFDLVQLGHITHTNEIIPAYRMILKGSVWYAATQQQTDHTHQTLQLDRTSNA